MTQIPPQTARSGRTESLSDSGRSTLAEAGGRRSLGECFLECICDPRQSLCRGIEQSLSAFSLRSICGLLPPCLASLDHVHAIGPLKLCKPNGWWCFGGSRKTSEEVTRTRSCLGSLVETLLNER